jgi:hypothetical protein
MSIKDTSALVPILDIEHILTSLVPSNYTLDRMITSFPEFFANVSDILESTSRDTLQGFLSWKVIQATAGLVEASEVKPYIRFSNKLVGKVTDIAYPLPRVCCTELTLPRIRMLRQNDTELALVTSTERSVGFSADSTSRRPSRQRPRSLVTR